MLIVQYRYRSTVRPSWPGSERLILHAVTQAHTHTHSLLFAEWQKGEVGRSTDWLRGGVLLYREVERTGGVCEWLRGCVCVCEELGRGGSVWRVVGVFGRGWGMKGMGEDVWDGKWWTARKGRIEEWGQEMQCVCGTWREERMRDFLIGLFGYSRNAGVKGRKTINAWTVWHLHKDKKWGNVQEEQGKTSYKNGIVRISLRRRESNIYPSIYLSTALMAHLVVKNDTWRRTSLGMSGWDDG